MNLLFVISLQPLNSSAVMALPAIPSDVIWSYSVGGLVLAIGLITMFLRAMPRNHQEERVVNPAESVDHVRVQESGVK